MAKYYLNLNPQPNGDYEVHVEGCVFFPSDKVFLGEFSNCIPAVREAKKIRPKSNGCKTCSNLCHTS